jgi:hypothetical protein
MAWVAFDRAIKFYEEHVADEEPTAGDETRGSSWGRKPIWAISSRLASRSFAP